MKRVPLVARPWRVRAKGVKTRTFVNRRDAESYAETIGGTLEPNVLVRRLNQPPAHERRLAHERARGRCEVDAPGCRHRVEHYHHRAGRGPGRDVAELLLACCFSCHAYVHDHPLESRRRGWMLSRTAVPRHYYDAAHDHDHD